MGSETLDLFTQRLLERTKARGEDLDQKMHQTGLATSATARKRPSPLREDNASANKQDVEEKRPCRTSSGKSDRPKKSVSFNSKTSHKGDGDHKENQGVNLKNRLQKLAALHSSSDEGIDSPPPKPRRLYPDITHLIDEDTNMSPAKAPVRKGRFAALADTYRCMEDEALPKNPSTAAKPITTARSPSKPLGSTSPSNNLLGKGTNKNVSPHRKNSNPSLRDRNMSPSSSTSFAKALEKFQTPEKAGASSSLSKVGSSPDSSPSSSPERCGSAVSDSSSVPSKQTTHFSNLKFSNDPSSFAKGQSSVVSRKAVWDKAVIATLEAQGFVHSPSHAKLEYNFKKQQAPQGQARPEPKKNLPKKSADEVDSRGQRNSFRVPAPPPPPHVTLEKITSTKPPLPKDTVTKTLPKLASKPSSCRPGLDQIAISTLAVKLRPTAGNSKAANPMKPVLNKCHPSIVSKQPDPAELPLSARVALFEQATQAEAEAAASSRFATGVASKRSATGLSYSRNGAQVNSPSKPEIKKVARSPSKVGQATEKTHRKLYKHTEDWKRNEIASQIETQRQKDMQVLLNRWERASDTDEEPIMRRSNSVRFGPLPTSQVNRRHSIGDNRRSQESTTSSELEPMGSLGSPEGSIDDDTYDIEDEQEVFERPDSVDSASTQNTEQSKTYSESDNDEDCDEVDGDVSALLNEALAGEEAATSSEEETDTSFVKHTLHDAGKVVQRYSPKKPVYDPIPPKKPDRLREYMPDSQSERDEELFHSISFYRRQKEECRTPVRSVVRREVTSPPSAEKTPEERMSLKEKMKALQEEVSAQQVIISQTSQALNLCRSTAEFYGSAEQVEGERLLLIASHKRLAALNEIQRLKTGVVIGQATGYPSTSGSLSVKEICLPLKKDFLRQTESGKSGDFVHFFLCLIKQGPQVVATQMLSTMENISDGALYFPNLINMRDLDCCFNIALEVYGLQTRRDQVTLDRVKTLTKKDKSRLNLTPKKLLSKQESRVQSPGGPAAVRTSSFQLIGFTHINIKTLTRKTWMLEKVPFISPLEGSLDMKIHCLSDYHIEESGFLNMFEDVGGFGAWHRRWCVLRGVQLCFWKYPDDEKRKDPIGSIDLRNCVTSNVGLVARDICARQNTFMLLTVRPPEEYDTDTLVSQTYGTYTSIKHLLSADTREERIQWCNVLNAALSNIRMWDPQALRPFEFSQAESD